MKLNKALLVLVAIRTTLAFAGGGHETGNGANVIRLPHDDRLHLADPYVSPPDGGETLHYADFDGEVQAEIERISYLLVRVGADVNAHIPGTDADHQPSEDKVASAKRNQIMSRTGVSEFIETSLKNPVIRYHFMDKGKLPPNCQSSDDVYPLLPGAESDLLACTNGAETWIDKFQYNSLTVRDRALTLVHERLHTVLAGNLHYTICEITSGLDLMLNLFNAQINGGKPVLKDFEVQKMSNLILQIVALRLEASGDVDFENQFLSWQITSGGGLVHTRVSVSPTAYVGMGSLIGAGSLLSDSVEVFHSTCYLGSCTFLPGSIVTDTSVSLQSSGDKTDFSAGGFNVVFGAASKTSHLGIQLLNAKDSNNIPSFVSGDTTVLNNSILSGFSNITIGRASVVDSVSLSVHSIFSEPFSLTMGQGASLLNLHFSAPFEAQKSDGFNPALTLSPGRSLDFSRVPICSAPARLSLKGALILDDPASLSKLCISQ